ncbi:U16-barytoxin-Tl1b, partial [Clarias magur]
DLGQFKMVTAGQQGRTHPSASSSSSPCSCCSSFDGEEVFGWNWSHLSHHSYQPLQPLMRAEGGHVIPHYSFLI